MFTVLQGRRYTATISLGLLERFASNLAIEEKLRSAGFTEVVVTGSGKTRIAQGLWPLPDTAADLPPEITDVSMIEV